MVFWGLDSSRRATGWPTVCTKPPRSISLAFLESDEGKKAIIALHVDGIENFIIRRSNEPL